MTKLFEKRFDFPYLRWVEGFAIGSVAIIGISLLAPAPAPAVVQKTVVEVVEKPVIVKEPVYMNENDRKQIQCLTRNAYFEAGNQSMKGKIAVTNVVMNRAKDKRFPSTPCGVVYQRTKRVCQFSWVCEGKKQVRSQKQYAEAREAAENVYLNNVGDVTNGAKFYHADYVNPRWNLRRIAKIGDHIFYKG
jgi:spore germination cell wall hydrolase CwlJ-like protein